MAYMKVLASSKNSKSIAIFDMAFGSGSIRTRRSVEFMQGVRAALVNAETANDVSFTRRVCPYGVGTCEHDAWHAGGDEGRRLWRINGGGL